jgi:hypothetical protein
MSPCESGSRSVWQQLFGLLRKTPKAKHAWSAVLQAVGGAHRDTPIVKGRLVFSRDRRPTAAVPARAHRDGECRGREGAGAGACVAARRGRGAVFCLAISQVAMRRLLCTFMHSPPSCKRDAEFH